MNSCISFLLQVLISTQYPDVVSLVQHMLQRYSITSCIIDAEIVAVDPSNGSLKSFQELSNRARKDVKIADIKVSVCVYAFDLMLLDGEVCRNRSTMSV